MIPPRPVLNAFWGMHRRAFRLSGGRMGTRLFGLDALGLLTTGRRSGQQRLSVLLYLPDGDRKVVVASNAGDDRPPAWLLNLRAKPRAEILIKGKRSHVTVREADPDEFDRLWPQFVAKYRDYELYRQNTKRRIPLVILEQGS
jgi:deazaflavin-dependent oxidoreductase (nitroreductase family)